MQQHLVKPPTAEPVSRDQAICHLRESDSTAQNELIDALITAARESVENFTRRILVQQTLKVTLDRFPGCIELPVSPVREVSSIQYVDTAGSTQTLSTANYQVDLLTDERVRIRPVYGETWPSTQPDTFNAVTVTFIAGFAVPFSTNYASDANQLDASEHPFSDGDVLQVWGTGDGLPNGLDARTNYYVINAAADAFELATSAGGTPITMTSDGRGQHFAGLVPRSLTSAMLLLIGHLYANREATFMGQLSELPIGVKSLLMPYANVRF